jgi:hypothetical protein
MVRLLGLDDFAAAQARGADAQLLGGALDARPHRTQVHIPPPPAHVMGVTDLVPELRPLAADITNLCHFRSRWSLRKVPKLWAESRF